MKPWILLFSFLLSMVVGKRMDEKEITKVFSHSHWKGSGAGNGRAWGAVVPLPRIIHPIGHPPATLALNPGRFTLSASLKGCDILNAAVAKYPAIIFPKTPTSPQRVPKRHRAIGEVASLQIRVKGPCPAFPQLGMNENYTLSVETNGTALLTAESVWGALRGLETFSQLVYSPSADSYRIRSVGVVDWPRFPHRGLLLDTSRHFLPLQTILETLELMSENKLNVFHWHVVDDPSFPYRSDLFPNIARKGAFAANSTGGHVYTVDDVRRVVEEARLRGIRVIPEFDSPGHTGSWGSEWLTECYKNGKGTGKREGLDVSNTQLWSFLDALFGEILHLFPDNFLHLGGDEVYAYKDCWLNNPRMANFRKAANLSTWEDIESYYFKQFIPLLSKRRSGLQVIGWNEVFDHSDQGFTPSNAVIQIWNGAYEEKIRKVTKAGYRAILSACWYLDVITRNTGWEDYYKCDPLSFGGSQEEEARVLGGEACLWGEYVDATNLHPRLWPRGSVVAERLWSSRDEQNIHQAGLRFDEHRCRLIARGFPAEPITGPGFCPTEWNPPSIHVA